MLELYYLSIHFMLFVVLFWTIRFLKFFHSLFLFTTTPFWFQWLVYFLQFRYLKLFGSYGLDGSSFESRRSILWVIFKVSLHSLRKVIAFKFNSKIVLLLKWRTLIYGKCVVHLLNGAIKILDITIKSYFRLKISF